MTTAEELAEHIDELANDAAYDTGIIARGFLAMISAKLREQERIIASQQRKIGFLISVVKSGEQIAEVEEEMLRDPAKELLA